MKFIVSFYFPDGDVEHDWSDTPIDIKDFLNAATPGWTHIRVWHLGELVAELHK